MFKNLSHVVALERIATVLQNPNNNANITILCGVHLPAIITARPKKPYPCTPSEKSH